MEYRGIKYEHIEWKGHEGVMVGGYKCGDSNLLSHTGVSRFTTRKKEDMYKKIDYYLDNVEEHKELKALSDKASGDFYKTLNYKGD